MQSETRDKGKRKWNHDGEQTPLGTQHWLNKQSTLTEVCDVESTLIQC